MKKRFLSLILCLCLVCGSFVLSACKKDTGYNLDNLSADYFAIADACTTIEYNKTAKRLEFNYSSDAYKEGDVAYLNEVLNNVNPYTNLANYNQIFYNATSFVNNNIKSCSNNELNLPRATKDELVNKLTNFKNAVISIDLQTQYFSRGIHLEYVTNKFRYTGEECLNTFKSLLDSYNNAFRCAYELNLTLSNIYYNNVNSLSNPNYSNYTLESFNSADVLVYLDSRIENNMAYLSYNYYVNNLEGGKISSALITKTEVGDSETFGSMGAEFTNYQEKIKNINKDIDVNGFAQTINADSTTKQNFLNCAIIT